ncbi:MAG: hypothetical protein RLZZ306_3400 [Bacteroidota bacterium]
MKHTHLYIILLMLGFTSCKSTKSITENKVKKPSQSAIFQVKSLKAINLEEELTFADEVVLTYSLTAVDENNKVVQVANGSWGVESMKKGQEILGDKFKTIELQIPLKGKVLSSVILTEIDDYQKAQTLVKKINEVGGLGKIPAMFIALGEYETPLAVVFASLQAAGIGLKAAEKFDKDDLLGQSTFDLNVSTLSEKQKMYPINLIFEGEHIKNKFKYELIYELKIR